MSKPLTLKLQAKVLRETEEISRQRKVSRHSYLNEAITFYNKLWKRKLLKKALAEESALVAADSLEVLETFEELSDGLDPEAPLSLVVRRNEGGGK